MGRVTVGAEPIERLLEVWDDIGPLSRDGGEAVGPPSMGGGEAVGPLPEPEGAVELGL